MKKNHKKSKISRLESVVGVFNRPKFLGGPRLGCEDILKLHLTIYGISGWTLQGPRTESDQGSGSGVEQKKKKKKLS